jgi:ABC-type glycerol-3-phosphate transport system substrate-binding protein
MVFAGGKKDAAAATATEKVKLTIWGRDLLDGEPDHAYATNLIKNFQEKNPDIELEYIALGDPGLADKTKVAMAAGTGPDIFQSWGGSVMGGYADAGRLLDMTAELKDVPGSAAAASAMTWKGKIYGVAPSFAIAGTFVNQTVFEKLGLKFPSTIADLEKVCDTLLANGIQPFACGVKDKWPGLATYMYLVNRTGGDAFGLAQSRKGSFSADAFVQAGLKLQEWAKKGYFGPTPLGEDYGSAQSLMATGKAAMITTGSWMCGQFNNPEFTDQKIVLYQFPILAGGVGKASAVMGMTDIGWCATKLAEGKKAAVVRFLTYAMSQEACSYEPGRIVSVPGVTMSNPITAQGAAIMAQAKTVQFWWDQDLPPAVTTPLNDTIQSFFLPDTDVKKALEKFEALATDEMGAVK